MSRHSGRIKSNISVRGWLGSLLWKLKYVFLVVVGVAFVLGGLYGWQQYLSRDWRFDDAFRILFTNGVDDFVLLEVAVDPLRVGLLRVPSDVLVDVFPVSYGEYRVGALYELGVIEGQDEYFLQRSLAQALGMMIDEVVLSENVDMQALTTTLKMDVFQLLLSSRINLFDGYRLYSLLREMEPSQITLLDLDDERVYLDSANQLFDAREFNLAFLDERLVRWQTPLSSNRQSVQVAVTNTTSFAGLADRFRRVIEREGFQVVRVSGGESVSFSVIVVRDLSDSTLYVLQSLADFWDISLLHADETELDMDERADVVVVLGEDVLR